MHFLRLPLMRLMSSFSWFLIAGPCGGPVKAKPTERDVFVLFLRCGGGLAEPGQCGAESAGERGLVFFLHFEGLRLMMLVVAMM